LTNVADILDRAADEMMIRGKATGRLVENDSVCAIGALCVANGMTEKAMIPSGPNHWIMLPGVVEFGTFLKKKYQSLITTGVIKCVYKFSDQNSEETVIEMMRLCAKELRENG